MSSINMYGTERVWYNILEPFSLDPSFIFEFRPLPSFSDEEFEKAIEEKTIDFGEYLECQNYWEGQFAIAYFNDHLALYDACRAKGYDREEDGYAIGVWIGEYLTPIIQNLREPDRISYYEWSDRIRH